MKKLGYTLTVLSLLTAMPGSGAGPSQKISQETGKVGKFDYSIPIESFTHSELSLSDFQGKKVILFYFSAICSHCQKTIPHVLKLAEELDSGGVKMIAVASGRNTPRDIGEFVRDFSVHIPVFHDIGGDFAHFYKIHTIPAVFLLNNSGGYLQLKEFEPSASHENAVEFFGSTKK